jgi:hypothetical protein
VFPKPDNAPSGRGGAFGIPLERFLLVPEQGDKACLILDCVPSVSRVGKDAKFNQGLIDISKIVMPCDAEQKFPILSRPPALLKIAKVINHFSVNYKSGRHNRKFLQ